MAAALRMTIAASRMRGVRHGADGRALKGRAAALVPVGPHSGDGPVDHGKMWQTMLTLVRSPVKRVESCSTSTSFPACCTLTFSVVSDVALLIGACILAITASAPR